MEKSVTAGTAFSQMVRHDRHIRVVRLNPRGRLRDPHNWSLIAYVAPGEEWVDHLLYGLDDSAVETLVERCFDEMSDAGELRGVINRRFKWFTHLDGEEFPLYVTFDSAHLRDLRNDR